MIFNNTITLYNQWINIETREKKWIRTVIREVMWKQVVDKTVSSDGKLNLAKSYSVTIPFREGYVDNRAYLGLAEADLSGKWTLNAENNLDIIALGEITQEISEDYSITQLKKDYSNVGTIASVSDNTLRPGLKHWKVICK